MAVQWMLLYWIYELLRLENGLFFLKVCWDLLAININCSNGFCAGIWKAFFLIPVTYNPKWPEITRQLEPEFVSKDREDVICRVFRIKMKQLLEKLTEQISSVDHWHMYGSFNFRNVAYHMRIYY